MELQLDPQAQGRTRRHYLLLLRRRAWLVALISVVAAGTAGLISGLQTPTYEGVAQIGYQTPLDIGPSPLTPLTPYDPKAGQVAVQSAARAILSPAIQRSGNALLAKQLADHAAYSVSASIEVPLTTIAATIVLDVRAKSPDARTAAAAANAFAEALIDYRKQQREAALNVAIASLKRRIKAYPKSVHNSPYYFVLEYRLQSLVILRSDATSDFVLLLSATVPSRPVISSQPLRDAGIGLAVGLFAGIGLVLLFDRFGTRLHAYQGALT